MPAPASLTRLRQLTGLSAVKRDVEQLLLPEDLPSLGRHNSATSVSPQPVETPEAAGPDDDRASEPASFGRQRLDDLLRLLGSEDPPEEKARQIGDLLDTIIENRLGSERATLTTAYSRSLYVIDREQLPPHVVQSIRYVGSISSARRSRTLGPVPGYAWALVRVIQHFYGVDPDATLAARLGNAPEEFPLPRASWGDVLPSLRGTLISGEPSASAPNSIRIAVEDDPDSLLTIRLDSTGNEHVRDAAGMLPKLPAFTVVNLTHLVREDDGVYATTPKTNIVLDPDFLFDVREIAACFPGKRSNRYVKNPYRYLLGLMLPPARSDAMFLGNLVNAIFDALVVDPDLSFDEVWERSLSDSDALSLALINNASLGKLRNEAQAQYPNLVRMARTLGPNGPLLEPTFLSAEYGLQGRLDALSVPSSDGSSSRDILELKSGKPPSSDFHWEGDRMQVMGYHLLLRSAFPGRTGTSRIFYSRRPAEQTLHIPETPEAVSDLLTVRNRALFLLGHVGRSPDEALAAVRWLWGKEEQDFGFAKEAHGALKKLFANATTIELQYFAELASFVVREWRMAATGEVAGRDGGFADLWRLPSVELKESTFGILAYLKFRDPDPDVAPGRLTFDRDSHHCQTTRFRKDDICVLYRHADDHLDPLHQQLVKGRLVDVTPEKVVFAPNHRLLGRDHFGGDSYWAIEQDFNDTAYESSFRSLVSFLGHPDAARRRVLLGLDPPRFGAVPELSPDVAAALTPHQGSLVARALSAQDYHLIQGPPGTGKTSGVLRCLVTQCLRQGEHVVVAAFTNRAVDEIERRLEENGLPFVRLGRPGGTNAFERAQSIRQGSPFVTTVAKLLQQHDQLLSLHRRIDTLIVDEASQVLEPQLIHLAAAVGRTVFIGDHCQLPPIVTQPARTTKISETSELRAHGFSDLRLTLFERLWRRCESMGWTSAFGMLEEHFRMHEQVAALVNENYGGKLKASTEAQRQEIRIFRPDADAPLERLMARLRTVFVSMSAAMGRGSAEEAGLIASLATLVRRAYGERFNAETLGVVTPWRVQINEIRKALDPELLDLVTVDTVERFQGMERDVIVISLAVGNRVHVERAQSLTLEEDGRLPVDRKLNVALSRARSHVIILGHEPVLIAAPQYRRLIAQIRRLGGYVENTDGLMGREAVLS